MTTKLITNVCYPFPDPNIPGRYLYEPIMSNNVQAGRLLSGSTRSTGAFTVPEQTGHGHLDVGRPRSVRKIQQYNIIWKHKINVYLTCIYYNYVGVPCLDWNCCGWQWRSRLRRWKWNFCRCTCPANTKNKTQKRSPKAYVTWWPSTHTA